MSTNPLTLESLVSGGGLSGGPQSRPPVVSRSGMVVTSNPLAAEAGLRALAQGGTAVDAVIAVDAVVGVVDPHLSGVGGDLIAIVSEPGRAPNVLLSLGQSGAGLTYDAVASEHSSMPKAGPFSVTVPGAVGGWGALHERHGKLPLSTLMAAAVAYATEGFPLAPVTSRIWRADLPKLKLYGDLMRVYGGAVAGGRAGAGTLWRAPELGRTLELIGERGTDDFYTGGLARDLVAHAARAGVPLSSSDLAAFRPRWTAALSREILGHVVHVPPSPSQGFVMLGALQRVETAIADGADVHSPEFTAELMRVLRAALQLRDEHNGDPDVLGFDPESLLNAALLEKFLGRPGPSGADGDGSDAADPGDGGTVYTAAADSDGMVVSFMSSVSAHFGSGVIADPLGMLLHNRGSAFSLRRDLARVVAPGRRPPHTLMPGLVESRADGGSVRVALGVTGRDMQPQGQAQILINLVAGGMDVQSALDSPRVRLDGVARPGVAVEPSIPEHFRTVLGDAAIPVAEARPTTFGTGGVLARDDRDGVLVGGAETRRDGSVAAH